MPSQHDEHSEHSEHIGPSEYEDEGSVAGFPAPSADFPASTAGFPASTASFNLNDDPVRPQSSVSQRAVNLLRQSPQQSVRGNRSGVSQSPRGLPPLPGSDFDEMAYMVQQMPPTPSEVQSTASEEHSRALYNVWTGFTSTVKDWVSANERPEEVNSADSFFTQVYKNAFGQVPVGSDVGTHYDDSYSEISLSHIPQEIPLPPEDMSDDDDFDARSMMEENFTVVGEASPHQGGVVGQYEEDIENRNKKRLKKTMKFLLQRKDKNGEPVSAEPNVEAGVDENGEPVAAVLKFRRSPLKSFARSKASSRPSSSGSVQSLAKSVAPIPPPSAGSMASETLPEGAPRMQQFLYYLAVFEGKLQPHFSKAGALVRAHPVGALFLYPMDVAVAVHPHLKFPALVLELVMMLCVLYVVANVVSSILTVLRFIFAPLIWIMGIGQKKK